MNFPFPKEKFLAILLHLAFSPLNQPWRFTANLGLKSSKHSKKDYQAVYMELF